METQPKTKVMFLITKSNWGGAQRYVFDLASNLNPQQYDVVVALGGKGTLVQKLQTAGIRTISLSSLERDISFTKDWHSFRQLYRRIRQEKPDVLHVNSSKAGGLGAAAGRLTRVPAIIYTAHGWAFNENRGWVSRQLVAFFHWLTIMLSHRTIAVSEAIRQQFRWPFVQRKMTVILNGIAPIEYCSRTKARAELATLVPAINTESTVCWGVTIAELHPVKQHETTIHAVAQLKDQGVPYRHVIIGEGENRHTLEQLIQELDLGDHVFLLGQQTGAARWLKAFDIFVLSSRSEALGYVLLEALGASLPIMATRVGGIPEVVPNTPPHQLVPSGDSTALSNAIKRTLSAATSIRSIEPSSHTLTTMQKATTALYHHLLGR